MTRAYLRLDPGFFERKAIDQGYPPGAIAAYVGCLCLAESQPNRGRFRDLKLLRAMLTPALSRWATFLIEHGDLIVRDDGRIYVDGWDQWQEGDLKVSERVALVRGSREEPVGLKRPGAIRVERHRLRTHIFARDAYTCRYCGNGRYPRDWLVLDHVDPKGPSDDGNLVTACRPCNKLKGGQTPEEAGMPLMPIGNALQAEGVTRNTATAEAVGGGVSNSGGGAPSRAPRNGHAKPGYHDGSDPNCDVCRQHRAGAA